MAQYEEAGLQDSQGGCAVLDLGLLILHGHDDAVGMWVMRTAESVVLTD